jgi:uncharacterized protein YbaP (TraB family)
MTGQIQKERPAMHHQHVLSSIRTTCARFPNLVFAVAVSLPFALLILLALGLVWGTGQARAEDDASCTGVSLVEQLARTDPEKLAAARADAAAVPNGSGLLWKVEKPGVSPSFLFGTMHVTDPRVTEMPEAARAAFDQAGTVVIETVDILDPAKAQAAFMTRPELTMFTDGTTLTSFLDEEDAKLVECRAVPPRHSGGAGLADEALDDCRHGGVAAMRTGPQERAVRVSRHQDRQHRQAEWQGSLLGLESIGEQMEAMADLPIEFHIRGLVETIKLSDLMPDIMATMTELYLEGEIAQIMPVVLAAGPEELEDDASGYAAFEERIVRMRNHVMAGRAAPILDAGNAFVAVGALHLPGKEGLVALLQDAGYTVTAIPANSGSL